MWLGRTTSGASFRMPFKVQARVCNTRGASVRAWPGIPGLRDGPGFGVDDRKRVRSRWRPASVARSSRLPWRPPCWAAARRRHRGRRGRGTRSRRPTASSSRSIARSTSSRSGPLAVIYRDWVPEPAQKSVRNLLDNLGEPVTAINEVFQGDPSRAATTMARFLVNSTIGVAGLFDVATMLGIEAHQGRRRQDRSACRRQGVEPENGGFYLVLPLVGPSNARDAHRPDDRLRHRSVPDPADRLNVDWLLYRAPRYGAERRSTIARAPCSRSTTSRRTASTTTPRCAAPTPRTVPTLIRAKREKTDTKSELRASRQPRAGALRTPTRLTVHSKERTVPLLACRRVVLCLAAGAAAAPARRACVGRRSGRS